MTYVILCVGIFILGFGVYSWFYATKQVVKRKLKKSGYSSLTDFKEGETAKIIGHVELINDALIAPLSRRECAYYYVHVKQRKQSGKNSTMKTIIEEEITSKFLIRENGFYAYINNNKIKAYVVEDKNYTSGTFNDSTPILEKYLKSHGYESTSLFGFNKSMTYDEGTLEPNELIAVYGKGTWKDSTELDLPKKFGKVLEILPPEDDYIYLSDDNRTKAKTIIEKPAPKTRRLSREEDFEKRYRK